MEGAGSKWSHTSLQQIKEWFWNAETLTPGLPAVSLQNSRRRSQRQRPRVMETRVQSDVRAWSVDIRFRFDVFYILICREVLRSFVRTRKVFPRTALAATAQ